MSEVVERNLVQEHDEACQSPERVVALFCDEAVALDPGAMVELRRRLGPRGAEAAAARALDAMTVHLGRVTAPDAISRPAGLQRDAKAIEELARQVGMRTLARAAAHLADAASRLEPAAMGATLARLARVGEASMDAIWELRARS